MSQHLLYNIKNLIEMREIKNFKTQKFKHQINDQLSYYSQLNSHHRHHPLSCNCTTSFNYWRIYQVTSSSSALSDVSLVQIASTLQLSIISTSCFKMYLTIVLLLSIVSSHIANCQAILERDNNILFLSKNNNLSEHLLQYVRSKQNVINKRLIANSKSTMNDKIVKNHEEYVKSISYPLETTTILSTIDTFGMWWPNRTQKIDVGDSYNQFKKPDSHKKTTEKKFRKNKLSNTLIASDILEISNINTNNQNQSTNFSSSSARSSNQHLLKIVMEGLGLRTLPDIQKANISQLEYVTKYNEYLDRVRERSFRELQQLSNLIDQSDYEESNTSLSLITIPHNFSEAKQYRQRRSPNKGRASSRKTILLRFPLNLSTKLEASDIEEANIRLLLITSPALATSSLGRRRHRIRSNRGEMGHNKFHSNELNEKKNSTDKRKKNNPSEKTQTHILNMKVYQLLEPKGRVWIDGRKIEIKIDRRKMDETTSQWLQFDVTKAVESWLINKQRNLGLEIQCDNCFRNGARIIDDISGDSEENISSSEEYDITPVLNIIGRLGTHREKRSKHHHNEMTEKPQRRLRKSNCYKDNQRCCRHTMEVVFKEIKGFEFIIQPKAFDAGYCRGRCPPRYNPAHHHALLQSLIWKQDRAKVPRPCCAPSKLIELEVLHVDEKDSEKLKISTWTDMRVLECACS